MPLVQTRGAASAQGFGEFAQADTAVNYIEDVFSTYLYTGNSTTGGTQTITNNIDLSTKGGMVWIKGRSAASNNILTDTTRGAGTTASNNQALSSNLATAEDLAASYDFLSAFNTTGFAVTQGGTTAATRGTNYNAVTYVSWTFRKQPKFFDIVTYTGNGTANTTIAHNLGSEVGCLIVKRLDTTSGWSTLHKDAEMLLLQSTNAQTSAATTANRFGDGTNTVRPTSTQFTLGSSSETNASGGTYVAYLFAHDAGGFGLTGTDNVISCGSYTGTGSAGNAITLGYEPQWLLVKNATTGAQNWEMFDNMRGLPTGGSSAELFPNTSGAERVAFNVFNVTATGFVTGTSALDETNASGDTYIYIAIRRGPMKVPTSGTSVYETGTKQSTSPAYITGFPTDMGFYRNTTTTASWYIQDRLRGQVYSQTNSTAAESADASAKFDYQNGFYVSTSANADVRGWGFRRAPSFFDEVCYTGDGSAGQNFNHNLGVAPELIIVKGRNSTLSWAIQVPSLGSGNGLLLNLNNALSSNGALWNSTAPTSTQFTVGTSSLTGNSGSTYVAYLFASCAGVSKVGSYTGNGSTQTIDCGFTGGARFVLIKRTDSTGDWYVWDTARGIVSGNDPYLLLNTTDAEVTNTDYIDTYSAGFEISSTAPAAINASGGSFIFLAIA